MSAALFCSANPERHFNRDAALAALERGDLVRLLAEVQFGWVKPDELEEVLERHAERHWFRQIVLAILGR